MIIRTKSLIIRKLQTVGLEVPRLPWSKPNPIHLWDSDGEFKRILKQIAGYTLVDKRKAYMLYQCALQAAGLPGEVAEVGVYLGGTAKLLGQTLGRTGKPIHLFDTFSGMPATDPARDFHQAGDFGDTSLAAVQHFLRDCPTVTFYQGFFPATAGPIEERTFCLVHIDVDIYRSVKDCCDFFYPRLVRSGVLVFDDYGFLTCPGAKAAVDEFFAGKPEQPLYLPTGQCLVVKL